MQPGRGYGPIIIEKSESAKFYAKSEFTTKEAVDGKRVWRVESAPEAANDILQDTTESTVCFIPITAGDYKLSLNAMKDGREYKELYTVSVEAPEKEPSPYIAKIFEILPLRGSSPTNCRCTGPMVRNGRDGPTT